MSFGLPQKTIAQLKSVFKKYPEITQVKVYGSRATNYYRRGSDIDLAFFSESEKDLSSNLSWELDDLPSPYLFDLVNYSTLNDSPLKEEIDKYGKVLYKKSVKAHPSLAQEKPLLEKESSKSSQPLLPNSSPFPHSPSFPQTCGRVPRTLPLPRRRESSIKTSETENLFEFKQTEIGEIPKNWEVRSIERLFDLKQGKSLSSKNQTGLYLKPFLRTSNVFWGHLDLKKVDEMDIPDKDRESLSLKKGDLLVCEGGDIGRTAIWNEELEECYYQNHIHRLRVKEDKRKNIFPLFYMYWMDAAVRNLNIYGAFGNRTTIPNLSGRRLLKFKVPQPSSFEQKKIAAVLSQIQKSIEMQDKLVEVTEELKQSTMRQLFTYGVKGQKIEQTEIGEMPEDWDVSTLGNICKKPEYGFTDTARNSGSVRFIRITDIEPSGRITETDKKFIDVSEYNRKYLLKNGDLLVARTGATFGKTTLFDKEYPAIFASYLIRLNFLNTAVLPRYYWFFSQSKLYWNQAYSLVTGGSQPQFNSNAIKQIKIPCPPLPEQKEISDILMEIDQKIQIHEEKKTNLKELFKTMLSKLMTGKIRVHQLDLHTNLKG